MALTQLRAADVATQFLDIRGRRVAIVGGAPDSTRILEDTFWPSGVLDVVATDPVASPDFTVEERVEPAAAIRELIAASADGAARAGTFEVTRGVHLPRYDAADSTLFVLDDGQEAAALVSSADARTLLRTPSGAGARWLARIVRDMATRFASADGALILHSSAFSVDDRTYLVVGDSGAGKSTTAVALARLLPGATWLGNDRIHVDAVGPDLRVTACPLPLAVNRGSLDVMGVRDFASWDLHAGHPEPGSDWDQFMGEDKIKLSHGEVERLLGIRVGATGLLHGVIFPRVSLDQPFHVGDADPAQVSAVLARNCFSLDDNLYGEEWLDVTDGPASRGVQLELAELERRLAGLTVLSCTLSGADDLAQLGEHLLARR